MAKTNANAEARRERPGRRGGRPGAVGGTHFLAFLAFFSFFAFFAIAKDPPRRADARRRVPPATRRMRKTTRAKPAPPFGSSLISRSRRRCDGLSLEENPRS